MSKCEYWRTSAVQIHYLLIRGRLYQCQRNRIFTHRRTVNSAACRKNISRCLMPLKQQQAAPEMTSTVNNEQQIGFVLTQIIIFAPQLQAVQLAKLLLNCLANFQNKASKYLPQLVNKCRTQTHIHLYIYIAILHIYS